MDNSRKNADVRATETQETHLTFSERFHEIRTGFERPFWVANISELFERLSYYAAFASLPRYLHESLNFGVERASSLAGLFGGLVWFLAAFGGALADRMGFRRALSLAYLILAISYFLLGSIGSPWLAPVRDAMPLVVLVTLILMLPALGIALVKPSVVGTTARASKENVRSIGYSIYYTLVNIGGAVGPFLAGWVHQHLSVEKVFGMAALSVFAMFFAVLLLFKEPRRSGEAQTESLGQVARNFLTVVSNWRFMLFLIIFSGYYIAFWQQFIILPIYIHDYVNANSNTEMLLMCGLTDGDRTADGGQYSHPENAVVSRHHAGHPHLGPGLAPAGFASQRDHGSGNADRSGDWRDHAAAALLRVHLAPRALRAAGNLYGLCLPAHWDWVARGRVVWRVPDSSLRRSDASAGTHLVGGIWGGRGDGRAALGL